MNLFDIGTLFTGIGVLITSIIGLLTYLRTVKIERQNEELKAQGSVTHDLVNSRSTALLEATQKASFREGKTEGRLEKLENGVSETTPKPPQQQ